LHAKHCTVYTPSSGVPRFPILRSANSDSPLKRHDLYGKQQLHRRCCAPLTAILCLEALRLKACICFRTKPRSPFAWPLVANKVFRGGGCRGGAKGKGGGAPSTPRPPPLSALPLIASSLHSERRGGGAGRVKGGGGSKVEMKPYPLPHRSFALRALPLAPGRPNVVVSDVDPGLLGCVGPLRNLATLNPALVGGRLLLVSLGCMSRQQLL